MNTPVLWQFALSHYAEKARWALDFKGVPYIRRSLLPGPHIGRIQKMTGQTATPVLELDGAIIHDSTRVIEAIEKKWPEPPLYPAVPKDLERALALEDFFDEELGPYLRRWGYFYLLPHSSIVASMFTSQAPLSKKILFRAMFPFVRPLMIKKMRIYPADAEEARKKTIAALDRLIAELQPSGYLVGDRFTVADLTAAALFWPVAMPKEFPYPLPSPSELPAPMAEARVKMLEHPAAKWVAGIYQCHRGKSSAIAEETVI